MLMGKESLEFDVLIIGAGPAGLSAAIRLAQLNQIMDKQLSIGVLEKGAEAGAHLLSGAVIDPKALNELIPDWRSMGAPVYTAVTEDRFMLLTRHQSWRMPVPPQMRNQGNYIISLGNLCRWLSAQAETLGVQIFTGFAATEVLYNEQNVVVGVTTGDKGIDRSGIPTENYQEGVNLFAKQVLFAEGCRGSLTQTLMKRFDLCKKGYPQTYGIGIKELWEIPPEQHQPGLVIHSVGWPLDFKTYGGSFLYHLENQQVAVGFVVGLDYTNPYLDPFQELQRFKTHPKIRPMFQEGRRLAYGARALNEGGWQSIPQLSFPGGLLIGDSAGFLNVPRIKGIHTAIKSGMIAAETLMTHWDYLPHHPTLSAYDTAIRNSWVGKELYEARNIRPAFQWGLWGGLTYAALDTYLMRGKAPWTLKHPQPDHMCLKKAAQCQPIIYPKPDHQLTFDKLSSVYLSNTHHEENQPCHLKLLDPALAINVNLKEYDAPETRYCPANVYEIITRDGVPQLQINAANCVHCKTCDIKDPTQNIVWTPPEGGDGPNYSGM